MRAPVSVVFLGLALTASRAGGDESVPTAAPGGGDRITGHGFATRAPVLGRHGMD